MVCSDQSTTLRILIVTQYFWPENFRINDLALGLVKIGHDVTVLTGQPNYPSGRFFEGYRFWGKPREMFQGILVVRVPLLARGSGSTVRLFLNYLSFALFASVLGPLRCRGAFDVIFVYEPSPVTVGLPALVLKNIKKSPIMFWVQDLWPESLSATGAVKSPWILALVESLVRFIYRGCDRVLVQSRAFTDRVRGLGVPHDRILYFPNSAEASYRPMSQQEGHPARVLPDGFRIMFAGNIGVAQSFETILAAAEALRDHYAIHWIILGEGRQSSWVQEEITRRGLDRCVHMLGQYPVESMPEWFARADALLVTLKKDPIFALTIPSKVQSYMACGRPILAALEGEGARIIDEAQAGLVVPAEDSSALAQAALRLYQMTPMERDAMGQNGRNYFLQEFERNLLLTRLDSWMKELVWEVTACAS